MPTPSHLCGDRIRADDADLGDGVAWRDHKIRFVAARCRGRDVLDLGCVQHDPRNYRSRFWLHKAIREVARSVVGVDLYAEGVERLRSLGFDVELADAQDFDLGRRFDVIVVGDLIEHLDDLGGLLESCVRHMHPESRLLVSTPNPWYWRNVLHALRGEVPNNPEHTCWLCPRTLRQLAARHGLAVVEVRFGSRYLRDRLIPLPAGWKHTSFHAELRLVAPER